jgi:aminoglycoside phosphotransferase (APT) family kinase protein
VLHGSHAQAVADRFGLGRGHRLTGPVALGRLGEIWRLDTDSGAYAVKQAREGFDVPAAERDATYQERVDAAGVPVPRVVRDTDGAVVAEVEGTPLRVYGWCEVHDADRRLDPVAVGRLLAAVHLVEVAPEEPVDGWYVDPVGAATWEDLLARLAAAGAPFVDRLGALVPAVLEADAVLEPPAYAQWCHRDLWADNLRASPAGGLVALDWESAGPAGPSQELAVLAFEFGLGEPDRVAALTEAYEVAGGPGRLRAPGDFTMLLAQQAHIVVAGCERWLAADTDAERADNEAWVAEFLDDPVTLTTVHDLLRFARRG